MKKLITLLIAVSAFRSAHAQYLGIGASVNHPSNGVNIFYSKRSTNEQWYYEAGIRIMVNTNSLYSNGEQSWGYQGGYANSFLERFSLNLRLCKKLLRWKFVELDVMSNLHLSCHSLLQKFRTADSALVVEVHEFYQKPSPAIELTAGLLLQVQVSEKVSLFGGSGVGYIYYNHNYDAFDRTAQTKTRMIPMDAGAKTRGDHEFVGADGLPMLTLGLKYKLH